jgi:hypothetical protein
MSTEVETSLTGVSERCGEAVRDSSTTVGMTKTKKE